MHHYIIFSSSFPYYSFGYHDLKFHPNVTYIEDLYPQRESKLLYLLFRLFFSSRLNKLFNIPFKNLFFSTFLPSRLDVNEEYRFVMLGEERLDFLLYLKERFKKSRFIYYRHDIFAKNPNLNVHTFKTYWDLCLHYDKIESEKYGLLYYETPYSIMPQVCNKDYCSDIYYMGSAKNRLREILLAYDNLVSKGFECKFFIIDSYNHKVHKSIKDKYSKIHFLSSKGMSYEENLQYVMNTKCILEIMQKGAQGMTPRVCESIAYDKILLTNNMGLKRTNRYDPRYMFISDDNFSSIDPSILSLKVHYPKVLKDNMNPCKLLDFIEGHLML